MSKRERLKNLSTSWANRTLASGRAAASFARAGVRGAMGRDGSDVGTQLAAQLDGMKGLAMKLGQMVSYLDGVMPDEVQTALRKLQSQGEPLALEAVHAVLVDAFGPDGVDRFDAFSPEPIAAASIGQVHRARVGDREVAVKVQYPEIAKTLEIDLGNADRLGRVASLGSPLDLAGLIDELRQRVREECDYLQEGASQLRFRELWADDPDVWIPEVLPSHSRRTVLTSAFVEGRSLYRFAEEASDAERTRAGEAIFRMASGSIFRFSAFNGDPHPGNYLFADDGRVAFLDYGCVRYFDAALITAWKRIARTVIEGRRDDLYDAMVAAGFVYAPDKWDRDAQWAVMQVLYQPFLERGFRYTREYVKTTHTALVKDNPNIRRTLMPPQWLLVNRLQWGLNSVLATLNATGRWDELYREVIAAPTVTGQRPEPLPG